MKILYYFPNVNTLSAGRTIANGYKNAFLNMNHNFKFLSNDDDQKKIFLEYKPNIFFTSLSPFSLKYLDLSLLKKAKRGGTKIFVNVPFWNSPFSKFRINEAFSLKNNKTYINLIKLGNYGDIYYNTCEQGDARMDGFKKVTGQTCKTILLAADKMVIYPEKNKKFVADISYIGTNLPQKQIFFKKVIFPLKNKYNIKIYGQDWTIVDRYLGYFQKLGQYFNFPYIKNIRKPKLLLSDERKIYTSSKISINVHEGYQKKFGDLNERTFKIPLAGGFEIVDDVLSLNKYFKIGKEIVVAKNRDDWIEKIDYYIKNPEKKISIIKAGKNKILKEHTYHNRVHQLLDLYRSIS